MSTEITMKEVKKHRSKKSVWVVIHNEVYDLTNFLDEHPGGADSLLEVAGKDGTEGFEDVGHSQDAREIMKKYKIGRLPFEEQSAFIYACCKPKAKKSKSSRSLPGTGFKPPAAPKAEPHVGAIVVPRESSKWKWILLALAAAIVVGVAAKKYSAK